MFEIARFAEETGGSGGLDWLVWVVLGLFAVMVFLGWLASSRGWVKQQTELVEHAGHADHGHEHPAHEDDHGHAPKKKK